jgi:colanic acid biosynthesis glycosyl transferase WcaI
LRKLHLLIIAQYFPPDIGGTSTRAYNAAKGLKDKGCSVTVLTGFPHYPHGKIPKEYRYRIYSAEDFAGIKVIRTWIPPISHYTYARRIALHASFILSSMLGLFKVRNIDIVIAMNPIFFCFFPALIFKMRFGVDMILNVDDLWPEVWYDLGIIKSAIVKKILDRIAKISYDASVAITPLSRSYALTLTNKYHIPPHKIFVIEHGVDTDRIYKKVDIQKQNVRERIMVAYSGGLSIGYDFKPVIEAAKLLESQPISFVLRGASTLADDIDRIRSNIHKFNVNNVEVRTERLSAEDLVTFLNTADIFLLPMNFVGFDRGLPTKALEYQAFGKPILCISNGEAADYVSRTRSGLVSRSKDPKEIAELIMTLVNDKSLAEELGKSGKKFIEENLTLDKIGEKFMKVITTNCKKL